MRAGRQPLFSSSLALTSPLFSPLSPCRCLSFSYSCPSLTFCLSDEPLDMLEETWHIFLASANSKGQFSTRSGPATHRTAMRLTIQSNRWFHIVARRSRGHLSSMGPVLWLFLPSQRVLRRVNVTHCASGNHTEIFIISLKPCFDSNENRATNISWRMRNSSQGDPSELLNLKHISCMCTPSPCFCVWMCFFSWLERPPEELNSHVFSRYENSGEHTHRSTSL